MISCLASVFSALFASAAAISGFASSRLPCVSADFFAYPAAIAAFVALKPFARYSEMKNLCFGVSCLGAALDALEDDVADVFREAFAAFFAVFFISPIGGER